VLSARGYGRKLHRASLDPPMHLSFAFITLRNAHLSPATRAFLELARRRVRTLS
jgi:LysR family transcriptional regulator, cyn operon transcriptional activator